MTDKTELREDNVEADGLAGSMIIKFDRLLARMASN